MNRRSIQFAAIAVVTIGLLYLAFRGQNVSEAGYALSSANVFALFGGIILMFFSHAVRAFRWQIVLRPLKERTSFWQAFRATIAGYGLNNIIPRSGEIVRPYLMSRNEGIPLAGAIASVAVERLADVLALTLLMIYALVSYGSRLTSAFPMFSGKALIVLAAMLAVLVLVILMFFSERRTRQLVRIVSSALPVSFAVKLEKIALDFSTGLRGIDRRALLPLVLGTIGIWALYAFSMYVSLQAFEATRSLSIGDTMLLLMLSGIAYTIPTPGGTGSYHELIKTGLSVIFGVPAAIGLAYAVATHALSYISTTLLGLVILISEGLTIGSLSKIQQTKEGQMPDFDASAIIANTSD